MHALIQSPQNEFWFHVANQDEIPIFGNVDKELDMPLLLQLLQGLPTSRQEAYIAQKIQENPEAIDLLRTFVGVSIFYAIFAQCFCT